LDTPSNIVHVINNTHALTAVVSVCSHDCQACAFHL